METLPTKVVDVLSQLEEAFYDIPFENSDYQNRAFVVAAQQTPARAYRALGLRMFAKIRAVKEYFFARELTRINLDELEYKNAQPDISDFDRRRNNVEIAKLNDGKAWGEKLLNDSLHELDVLYEEFKKFPRFTREQFESEETWHFTERLNRQLQVNGAGESLLNMQQDMVALPQLIEQVKAYLTHKQ